MVTLFLCIFLFTARGIIVKLEKPKENVHPKQTHADFLLQPDIGLGKFDLVITDFDPSPFKLRTRNMISIHQNDRSMPIFIKLDHATAWSAYEWYGIWISLDGQQVKLQFHKISDWYHRDETLLWTVEQFVTAMWRHHVGIKEKEGNKITPEEYPNLPLRLIKPKQMQDVLPVMKDRNGIKVALNNRNALVIKDFSIGKRGESTPSAVEQSWYKQYVKEDSKGQREFILKPAYHDPGAAKLYILEQRYKYGVWDTGVSWVGYQFKGILESENLYEFFEYEPHLTNAKKKLNFAARYFPKVIPKKYLSTVVWSAADIISWSQKGMIAFDEKGEYLLVGKKEDHSANAYYDVKDIYDEYYDDDYYEEYYSRLMKWAKYLN